MKLHFSTDSARISDPGVKLCPLRHFITSGGALCFCSKALWQNQSETRLFRLLRLSAGGKLSSPLTSEGQPEKNPPPKKSSPSHNPPGRAGGKTAGLKWRGRWKRAASFTASLLTVLLCVCVWQALSLLPSMLRGSVRSKVVGGHFLSISRRRI